MIPPLKHLCYAAIVDLFKYLPQSKADPNDIHARQSAEASSRVVDESLAGEIWTVRVNNDMNVAMPLPIMNFLSSGTGYTSHVIGHRLGATYGIPHGITSVGLVAIIDTTRGSKIRIFLQCLTLAPTIKLKAKVASEEDKQLEWLAGALHQLKRTSTGSLEGDVVKLSVLVDE
jgi:alcohol dehydrogenase class IV